MANLMTPSLTAEIAVRREGDAVPARGRLQFWADGVRTDGLPDPVPAAVLDFIAEDCRNANTPHWGCGVSPGDPVLWVWEIEALILADGLRVIP